MHNHTQPLSAQVRFENVNVHYYSKPAWLGGKPFKALDQLNLSIETQNLAIVGPSGAGKSTLIELLFSLRRPTSGEVYICGQPLSSSSDKQRRALCRHIQLIPQEPQSSLNPYYTVEQILSEPLVSMGLTDNKQQKIENALRDVGLTPSLLTRPSRQLSVGQAQRVAIARALLKDAPILLLDEATSALDAESETKVQQALERLMVGRTTLVVAHRLATIKNADRILVLEGGTVIDEGTHDQLVEKGGRYAELAKLQFQQ